MPSSVKVLIVGDIVGKGARNAFISYLPKIKEKYKYDIISVNAENTTHGNGLSYKHYLAYQNANIDVMTMGNHTFGNKEIYDYIEKTNNLVVPGNIVGLDERFLNHRSACVEFEGKKIKFINVLGKNGLNIDVIDPLSYIEEVYKEDDSILIVDVHAEYTAEKNIIGYMFDGKASLIYGTHTHVQTADERILPKKTAFITDCGMCGSRESIIGYDYNSFIKKAVEGTPSTVSKIHPFMLNAILVEIDLNTKEALSILRINENME